MAVTSGFFNAINHDRKYDARQMAELFDGLINDGVYETIYNQFRVSPNNGFTIQVDTGRGWFKHTWIKNDNLKLLSLDSPHSTHPRIDAVIIEVDHTDPGRIDTIKLLKGTPSASPVRPTLIQTDEIFQVPLAYITVNTDATEITKANIANMIGTSACPFVTGVVSVMNIDMLIEQWEAQWRNHVIGNEYEFRDWFDQLRDLLDGDVAAKLADRILALEEILDLILYQGVMYSTIDDNHNDPILDSFGKPIDGTLDFYSKDTSIGGIGSCSCKSISNSQIDTIFNK